MAGRYGDLYHLDERESNVSESLLGSFDSNDNYGTNSGRQYSLVPGNREYTYSSSINVEDLEDFDPFQEHIKKSSCTGNACKNVSKKLKKLSKTLKNKLSKKKGGKNKRRKTRRKSRKRKKSRKKRRKRKRRRSRR